MKKVIFTAFICLLASTSIMMAQSLSSPISAVKVSKPNYFGIFTGLGQNIQSGDLYVDCPSAVFSGGAKFGFNVGVLFEHFFSEKFAVGVAGEYNSLGIDASFGEIEPVAVSYQQNGETITENANIQFENEVNTSIHNISIMPYAKYNPFKFMFLRGGFSIGSNISTNLKHTKTVSQSTVRLSNGEIAALKVSGSGELQNSEITELNSPSMYFVPALGFDIPLSRRFIFSPVFEYGIPLSNLTDWGKDCKVGYWRIIFELRMKFENGEKNTSTY